MAHDEADIGRLKAAVPDIYRPRDAAGMLSNRFDFSVDLRSKSTALQGSDADPVGLANRLATASARELHNLSVGFVAGNGDRSGAGFLLTGAQVSAQIAQRTETQQRGRDDERFALNQADTALKAALDARLKALDAELGAIDTRLEEIRLRRIEITDSLDAMDDIEQLARDGKLDKNNEAHRRLAQKAGIDPDKLNAADIARIIAQRRGELDAEDGALDTEWNRKMKRRGQIVIERKGVADARGELENANTDEARLLAERRARSVLGAQELGEAASETRNQTAKVIAADAVGISAKSESQNRNAALDTDTFLTGSDDLNWSQSPSTSDGQRGSKPPPPTTPAP